MPKMKSNRGAKKRFRVTATGKVKHRRNYKSHILTKKSPKRKRKLRKYRYIDPVDVPRVKAMILES
ncbi:MAG: 50S ribosomal protein L35 [Calditrichaeota bacterium]|nr:MAG: 50S ribosomal protein L35 [Calditrichota bacterium]